MNTNVTFPEIVNQVYNIFSDDRQAAAYMADSFGPQYIGLCGWAGTMSPANRAAFVATFGRDVTDRAEAEARARVREYRAAVAASAYHRHELEADAWKAAYGSPEKSQAPEVGAFVWGRWSCLKGEDGPLGELEDLERMEAEGDEIRRRLCEVVAVVDASPAEFLNREFADGVARQFQELGGSRYEESDPCYLDGRPMSWELVFCVRCGGRWYLIDGQGYNYTRYFLMPDEYRRMYAAELATITAAREDEERRQKEEEQRQAEARRADYLARCARWAPLMEDVTEAKQACDATPYRDRKAYNAATRKLAAIRRRNLVAMASALFPGVKFSAKKWDGWGGSYVLTWTDGPTEEHLEEAGDFRLFESGRDTFDGMTDCADVQYSEFGDFAAKYFGLFGEIRMNRDESDEFRQSIRDRIRAAVPGLPEGDQERITDGGQLSAICGMFREVPASYLVERLERWGLRDAVTYIARCMDATPAQDEPTDPTPDNGGTGAAYADREKSQPQDAPAAHGVEVVGYSEKALAVFGDTRALADELKAIGAKFNRALSYHGERRAGWIISRRKADELAALLAVPQEEPEDERPYYNGVTWNPADLVSSKQAAAILMNRGASWQELEALDFGGLDLAAVWNEEHPEDDPTEPTDPNGGGSPALPEPPAAVVYDPAQPVERAELVAVDAEGATYGETEKSQLQESDEWGRTAETQAINAALVVVPSNVMRDFGFIADSGEIVTNTGRAALLHPSRGFVVMPDGDGTPYTPAGGADALAEILQAGGFLNFDGFRFVWPIEHNADTIRRVLAAYGVCEKSQNPDDPTDEIGHPVEYYNGVTWNPADLIGCKQAACILMRQGATWAELEPLDFGGLDLSAVWDEEHPDDEPTDGGEDSPAPSYGETEKSQVPDHLADIYQRAKAKRPDAVALFHCGDWFTAYGEDADRVADVVGIIITTTRDGFRKASFPFAALDTYLPRMVRQGMKVCICEVPRQAEPSIREKVAQEV